MKTHTKKTQTFSARSIALDILRAILTDYTPMDQALAFHPGFSKLEERDRAFARMLISTTLRNLPSIDGCLKACMDKPGRIKAKTRQLLRLGLCQLLYMDVPAHAAVDETVRLAPKAHTGMVNAVLRRVDREKDELFSKMTISAAPLPDFIWDALTNDYGEDTAAEIALACLQEPPTDLALASLEEAEKWAAELQAEILPGNILRTRRSGSPAFWPGFKQGVWWVQDYAATIPVRIMSDRGGDIAGKTIYDLCAAPGGKTAALATRGAQVTALDISASRLRKLNKNMQRLGLDVQCVTQDALYWHPPQKADIVLLDAPCSATGTMRRHPDLPYIKSAQTIKDLLPVQQELLARSAELGNEIVYAVCSLDKREGERQIEHFLSQHPDWHTIPAEPDQIGGLDEAITAEGWVRTLPCFWGDKGGMDGFFVARLGKQG